MRQADIQRHEMKLNLGNRRNMKAAEMIHPNAIVGMIIIERLFHFLAKYLSGNSVPMTKSPIARVTRVISRVMAFVSL